MSKGALNIFSLVINFLTLDLEPKHIIIGLFETRGTIGKNLANKLQALLEKYKFTNKIICYVKDEGENLSIMINDLKQIVSCEKLGILAPFEGVFLDMPFLKLFNLPLLMKRQV